MRRLPFPFRHCRQFSSKKRVRPRVGENVATAKAVGKAVETVDLTSVSGETESAMVSLLTRVKDARSAKPVLNDPFSVQMWERIKLNAIQSRLAHWSTRGLAAASEPFRSLCIDDYVASAIVHSPQPQKARNSLNSVHILELGVGFDLRSDRIAVRSEVKQTKCRVVSHEWDTEECTGFRQQLLECCRLKARCHRVTYGASLTDANRRRATLSAVAKESHGATVVIVAEALFQRLNSEALVSEIIRDLQRSLPHSFLICDFHKSVQNAVGQLDGTLLDETALLSIPQLIESLSWITRIFVVPYAARSHRVQCYKL